MGDSLSHLDDLLGKNVQNGPILGQLKKSQKLTNLTRMMK